MHDRPTDAEPLELLGVRAVMLFSDDPERSCRWWADVVGLEMHTDGGFCWVDTPAGVELSFHPFDDGKNPFGASTVPFTGGSGTWTGRWRDSRRPVPGATGDRSGSDPVAGSPRSPTRPAPSWGSTARDEARPPPTGAGSAGRRYPAGRGRQRAPGRGSSARAHAALAAGAFARIQATTSPRTASRSGSWCVSCRRPSCTRRVTFPIPSNTALASSGTSLSAEPWST